MKKEFQKTAKNLARKYEQGGAISAQFEIEDHKERVAKILAQSYKNTMNVFGERVLRGFKSIYSMRTKAVPVSEKTWEELRDEWIGINAKEAAESIGDTTFNTVGRVISDGLENNLSNIDIAESIVEKIGGVYSENRSILISRTEVHSASQAATNEMAKTLTIKVKKQWVSASDNRVRTTADGGQFDHQIANGETVDLDKKFVRTGQPMDYPGDKNGSVSNYIRCRCVQVLIEQEES